MYDTSKGSSPSSLQWPFTYLKTVIILPFSPLFSKLNKPAPLSLLSQSALLRLLIIFIAFKWDIFLKISLRKCCNWYITVLHQYSNGLKRPLILLPNKLCKNQNYTVKQTFLGFLKAAPQSCTAVAPYQVLLASTFSGRERDTKI